MKNRELEKKAKAAKTELEQYDLKDLTPPESVSYFIYQLETSRKERAARRWMIAAIIAFLAFVASNVLWIVYENQFEDVVVTQENEDGYNSYIGHDGDIHNGETDDQDTQT